MEQVWDVPFVLAEMLHVRLPIMIVNVPRKIHYRQYYLAVVQAAANDDTRHQALDFFKREYVLSPKYH